MNIISFFKILFNYPDDEIAKALKSLNESLSNKDNFKEQFFKDHKFIEATALYLNEIELIVHGNIDFNKDKHNIQNLIKKFEDFELSLSKRFRSKETIISVIKELLTGNISPDCIPIRLSEIEEAKKIQNLITGIRERKTKVDERIKELGIRFFFK
jgi:hypothetical protein